MHKENDIIVVRYGIRGKEVLTSGGLNSFRDKQVTINVLKTLQFLFSTVLKQYYQCFIVLVIGYSDVKVLDFYECYNLFKTLKVEKYKK